MSDTFSLDLTVYEATVLLEFIDQAKKAGVPTNPLIPEIQKRLQEKSSGLFKQEIDNVGTDENGQPYRG